MHLLPFEVVIFLFSTAKEVLQGGIDPQRKTRTNLSSIAYYVMRTMYCKMVTLFQTQTNK